MLKRIKILNMYVPSDKSVSMAILRIIKENPKGIDYNILFEKLPYWCRSRIRSIWELRGFFELYKEFHHDCDPYAKKCIGFEPEIDQKSERNLKNGEDFDSYDVENFSGMSPIDVIGDGELVLEI